MAIKLVKIEDGLRETRFGPLIPVELHALSTVRDPYRAALLQPTGVIEATPNRVGHFDRAAGHRLCADFLRSARDSMADLAVAPEYCVPWSVVDEIIGGALRPAMGAIWILGCESIAPADLNGVSLKCEQGNLIFHHETLDARQVAQKQYVDPVLYVFWSKDAGGIDVLCLVAQFKTTPCRDERDVEINALYRGTHVYVFSNGPNTIQLITIICSDAFDFTPQVANAHRDCLLIHIQLNQKPAHPAYAAYREELISVGSASNVELLCLNWAKNVIEMKAAGNSYGWDNVAGSAWYVPPSRFDGKSIDELHRRGVYYSMLSRRWHAFFLNYDQHILLVRKQKVFFIGAQALAPRNCIEIIERYCWDSEPQAWKAGCVPDDGFETALQPYGLISQALSQACTQSPVAVERALEALVGPPGKAASWFEIGQLDAMQLHPVEESIQRVTVHQEIDPERPGVIFRKQRLQRAQDAIALPGKQVPWPASLRDLESGFVFGWSSAAPHHNVVPTTGAAGSAMLVYLSDEADDAVVEKLLLKIRNGATAYVVEHCQEAGWDSYHDEFVRSHDRLCIVFRRDDEYFSRSPGSNTEFDKPFDQSPVDISREAP